MARCAITVESFPAENSITEFRASATTSRMMWITSDSSAARWFVARFMSLTRIGTVGLTVHGVRPRL